LEIKIAKIKKFKQADGLLENLLLIIKNLNNQHLSSVKVRTTLIQGDLIIHKLLTENGSLTGVIDWELALWGDPDYDFLRLLYYKECAKAYYNQGVDETYEREYMDKLIETILKSKLIKNKKVFWKKYKFARAIFYLNAFYWAAGSNDPEKNINELIVQLGKKRRVKRLRT
jgi:aminoglycoside phosphotransferase (APT) family kinase protein